MNCYENLYEGLTDIYEGRLCGLLESEKPMHMNFNYL